MKAPARGRIDDRQGRALMAERLGHGASTSTRAGSGTPPTPRSASPTLTDVDATDLEQKIRDAPGRAASCPVDHAAQGRLRQDRGGAADDPRRLDRARQRAAGADQGLRAGAARRRRAGDRRAGREVQVAGSRRATPSASGGCRRRSTSSSRGRETRSVVIRDVEDGVVEKTLRRWRGSQGGEPRDDARPRRPARRRAGAGRRRSKKVGAGGAAALHGRRAGGRQPAVRTRRSIAR